MKLTNTTSQGTNKPYQSQLQEQREIRHREYAGMVTQSDFNGYSPSNAPIPLTYIERELAHQRSDFFDDTYEDTMTTFNEFNHGGIN